MSKTDLKLPGIKRMTSPDIPNHLKKKLLNSPFYNNLSPGLTIGKVKKLKKKEVKTIIEWVHPVAKRKQKGLEDEYDSEQDNLKIRYALIQTK